MTSNYNTRCSYLNQPRLMIEFACVIALLLGLAIWTLREPSVAVAGVVVMFALEQWAQASSFFFVQYGTLINYYCGSLVVAALCLKFFRNGRILRPIHPVLLPIALLFLYSLLSISWSIDPETAYAVWSSQWPYMVTVILLAPLLLLEIEDFNSFMRATLVIGTILVAFLFFTGNWQNRVLVIPTGISTTFGNPLAIAEVTGAVAFAAVYYQPANMTRIWSVARWGIGLLCLALIVRSGSRGQLIGTALGIILVWPIAYRIKNVSGYFSISVLSLAIASVSLWAISTYGEGDIRWTPDQIDGVIIGRLENNLVMLSQWANSNQILFSLGNSASYELLGIYPHNVPIEILTEEGFVGISMFLVCILMAATAGHRAIKLCRTRPDLRRILAFLVALIVLAFTLLLKQGSLVTSLNFFMFLVILGRFERVLRSKLRTQKATADTMARFRPSDNVLADGIHM